MKTAVTCASKPLESLVRVRVLLQFEPLAREDSDVLPSILERAYHRRICALRIRSNVSGTRLRIGWLVLIVIAAAVDDVDDVVDEISLEDRPLTWLRLNARVT